MSDVVYIRGLKVDAVIGVYDWERSIRQTLVLDLELACDNRAAAATDAIEDAVDYDTISGRILAYVGDSEFQLIETLAERVAELVQREFAVPWVRLQLAKPGAVAAAQSVGVIIERGERS
jgi:dihydroneopterin aldolase